MDRRRLMLTGLAGMIMPAAIRAAAAAEAPENVRVVIPENSVFVLNWLGGKDAGVFAKHGIDLEVDVRPFAGFLAGLPAKQCPATTYSGIDAILKINQGLDWVIIGGGLTLMEDIIVRKDSPIKGIAELRGKNFGTFSTGAGSFKAARAAMIDAYGVDVVKDTKVVQLAAPALLKVLENGSVDAMINISSFTIKALSQPDKFRSIFSPNDYWREKTGYPIVWTAPLVAWRSWVDENRRRAKNFVMAAQESFRWLRNPENLETAVKSHGTVAGISTPEAIATYKKLLGQKQLFLAHWDAKVVAAQWKFLEMAKVHGVLDAVPPADKAAIILEG